MTDEQAKLHITAAGIVARNRFAGLAGRPPASHGDDEVIEPTDGELVEPHSEAPHTKHRNASAWSGWMGLKLPGH